jgi:hypothetical protein
MTKTLVKPSILPDELTLEQRQILANAANTLGFYMPVLGQGFKSIDLTAENIQGIYLYADTYELKTTYGTNCFKRDLFKAAVTIYK